MFDLLLNPNGRILRNRFWQGMVILTVGSVLITAGSTMVSTNIGYLSFLLIFPYICVYGKRLHDAGFSAWLVIGVWLTNMGVVFFLSMFLRPFFTTAETASIENEINERLAAGDFTGMFEGAQILAEKMLPMNLLLTVLGNLIVALIIGFLRTVPNENKHGPVPGRQI